MRKPTSCSGTGATSDLCNINAVLARTLDHESGAAMSRLMATWRCRVRAAPRLRRAARPCHRQPCGFHRRAGHECGLRRTRTCTNGFTKPTARQSINSLFKGRTLWQLCCQYSCSPTGAHSCAAKRHSCRGACREPKVRMARRRLTKVGGEWGGKCGSLGLQSDLQVKTATRHSSGRAARQAAAVRGRAYAQIGVVGTYGTVYVESRQY